MAIKIYDEVLISNPEDWEAYHYKGVSSMNNKSNDMALACFNKAIEINNNDMT